MSEIELRARIKATRGAIRRLKAVNEYNMARKLQKEHRAMQRALNAR